MNTLWTFGDSFTLGHGCASWYPSKYNKLYPKGDEFLWTSLVAKELNLKCENKGWAGFSNSAIVRTLVQSLGEMKAGDIVIIGKTDSFRFEIPVENGMRSILAADTSEKRRKIFKRQEDKHADIIYNYIEEIQVPYYQTLENENNKSIKSIQTILKKIGVRSFTWSYGTPSEYDLSYTFPLIEKIHEHTNGQISDNHFSWKGHEDFSNIILKIIKDKRTDNLKNDNLL